MYYCYVVVDDEGCLTNMMLDTVEYYQYRQFSLVMGVLTILIGLVGVVGNVIR